MICFNCGKQGHQAKFCDKKGPVCFKCRQVGHLSQNCNNSFECLLCKHTGHIAIYCPYIKINKSLCYYCNKPGHFARDCYNGSVNDGNYQKFAEVEQLTKLLPNNTFNQSEDIKTVCYICKKVGHIGRNCSERFNCNENKAYHYQKEEYSAKDYLDHYNN